MPWQRLQTDFRFALITLFGTLATLCLVPIAVYRFMTGATATGFIDLGVVIVIAGSVVYMWRGGSVEVAGRIAAGIGAAGVIVVSMLVGLAGLLWVYAVVVASFLIVGKRTAIAYGVVTVLTVAAVGTGFDSAYMRVAFAVTGLVVGLFAYIFAHRTEHQRMQLEQLVTRDALTSAANRRAMEQELPIAIAASRRNDTPVSLAVLDIDHFKHVNDEHGHETGDRVLVDFARVIAATTRRGDRLFRYGGEEFVLLLPGIDATALPVLCETLRQRVADQVEVGGRPITMSVGAAELGPEDTASEWLARADSAMYRAKRDGRNRVVVATTPGTGAVIDLLLRQAARRD
ncbi:GGDEF domain-containing protein [Cognatilysobacter bugurensis]|uniref:diguanylate cyclase n=1 Tax=Cognatilysobacter bugurensis TaxID=543356 RepID=A0A918T3P6_9GAMM|nr:GGDEF domain-containing protein [Lysobacter bugurensis]GHA82404.1 GGDEF domain-containing protein [Lysobacter bugurensis]